MCVPKLKVKFNLILDRDKNKNELNKELDGEANIQEYYNDVTSQQKQPFRF